MNAIELIRLKQLRFEVASRQVLETWQPEDLRQPKCPKCQTKAFLTPHVSQERPVAYCIGCNYYFKQLPPTLLCQCTVPGQQKTCHGCPNFDRFMELINLQILTLDNLTIEELQELLSDASKTG